MAAAPNHAACDKREHSSLGNDSSGGLVTRVDLEPGLKKKGRTISESIIGRHGPELSH